MRDATDVFYVVAMWIAGAMVGFGIGGAYSNHMWIHKTQQIQVLQAHGASVTIGNDGKIWGWDEKHKVSYKIETEDLDNMVRGLR